MYVSITCSSESEALAVRCRGGAVSRVAAVRGQVVWCRGKTDKQVSMDGILVEYDCCI